MEMDITIFDKVMKYGIEVAIIAYFAYKDWKVNRQVGQALNELTNVISILNIKLGIKGVDTND